MKIHWVISSIIIMSNYVLSELHAIKRCIYDIEQGKVRV